MASVQLSEILCTLIYLSITASSTNSYAYLWFQYGCVNGLFTLLYLSGTTLLTHIYVIIPHVFNCYRPRNLFHICITPADTQGFSTHGHEASQYCNQCNFHHLNNKICSILFGLLSLQSAKNHPNYGSFQQINKRHYTSWILIQLQFFCLKLNQPRIAAPMRSKLIAFQYNFACREPLLLSVIPYKPLRLILHVDDHTRRYWLRSRDSDAIQIVADLTFLENLATIKHRALGPEPQRFEMNGVKKKNKQLLFFLNVVNKDDLFVKTMICLIRDLRSY